MKSASPPCFARASGRTSAYGVVGAALAMLRSQVKWDSDWEDVQMNRVSRHWQG